MSISTWIVSASLGNKGTVLSSSSGRRLQRRTEIVDGSLAITAEFCVALADRNPVLEIVPSTAETLVLAELAVHLKAGVEDPGATAVLANAEDALDHANDLLDDEREEYDHAAKANSQAQTKDAVGNSTVVPGYSC